MQNPSILQTLPVGSVSVNLDHIHRMVVFVGSHRCEVGTGEVLHQQKSALSFCSSLFLLTPDYLPGVTPLGPPAQEQELPNES